MFDTKDAEEGQRRFLSGQRSLEREAVDSATRIEQEGGKRLANFFTAIERPGEAARQTLIDLATQSRRTGEDVSAGAAIGTNAIKGLALAGLAAYTSLKLVQKTMDAVRDLARSGEMTQFMAGWAGTPVPWMSRLSNVVFEQTGLPQEQTQSWLVGLRSSIEAYRSPWSPTAGQLTGPLQTLANMGIPFQPEWQNLPADQIIQKITEQVSNRMAEIASGRTQYLGASGTPAAIEFGRALGMPPQMAQALLPGWAKVSQEMDQVVHLTDAQTKAEHELSVQMRTTETDTQQLGHALLTQLAPGLEKVLGWVQLLVNAIGAFLGAHPDLLPKQFLGGIGTEPQKGASFGARVGEALTSPVTAAKRAWYDIFGWPTTPQTAGGGPIATDQSLRDLFEQPGGIDQLVDAMIRGEGGSPAGVVNNPGNIKFTGAPGQLNSGVAARDGGTFASYATPDEGRAAIAALAQRAASGQTAAYGPNPTVGSFAQTYRGGAPLPATAASPADTGGSFTPQPDTTPGLWQRVKNWWQGPSHQKGEAWTSEGLAWLHQGERVLSKTENEILTALLGSAAGFPGSLVAGGARQAAQTTAWPWVAQARNDLIRLLWPSFGTGEPWALQSAYYTMSPWLTGLMLGMSPSRLNRGEVDAIAARPDLYPAVTSVQRQLNAIRRGMISQMWSQTRNITNRGGNVSVGPILTSPGANPYAIGHAVADALRRERIVSTFQSGQE